MTAPLINVIFIGLISVIAFETIWYWHRNTKGTWKDWPAGRSLMGLLNIIAFGFGYGVINQFLGPYGAKPFVGFGLYLLFIGALIVIRLTIRAEMRRGKKRLAAKTVPTPGPVTITVATANEEKHDV